ncbi:SIMPL domain-containing protein [Motiliproteus sp. MSK22-1]|uniref:SIMPL domain-containing protein n=1 Tax=Motiliproteus sp. MSK22-1 TaxID=1897630 RepID=UPI000977DEF5|nr:SIMPL domain-containing protein [Motiliproteus sp. MSK22-1]OMH25268.1 hypothetical protein BGP75_26070 [Motiliproteus sp. MSK22-1]
MKKRLSTLCLFSTLLFALSAQAENLSEPTLDVRGEATVEVPADQVGFRVGVETSGKTAAKALEQNNRLMSEVRKSLSKEGLSDSELKTGSFSISPQWSPRPRQSEPDWKATIVGYVVSNHLEIETSKLQRVGEWINVATEAGANTIGQLEFGLKNPDEHRNQAIRLATQKARGYALAAAEAAEVELLSVSAIQVDGASIRPMGRMRSSRMEVSMLSTADAPVVPQVVPGEIEVRASVSLSYKITP